MTRVTKMPRNETSPRSIMSKAQADQKAKEDAHATMSIFKNICELYNTNQLENLDDWGPVLPVYQRDVIAAQKIIVYLHSKENCSATRSYLLSATKLLIRFSSLIHNKRKETPEEMLGAIHDAEARYGSLTLYGEEI